MNYHSETLEWMSSRIHQQQLQPVTVEPLLLMKNLISLSLVYWSHFKQQRGPIKTDLFCFYSERTN